MKNVFTIVLFLITLCLESCSGISTMNKHSYLKKYESLVAELECDYASLTDEQFKERMKVIAQYGNEYYQSVKKDLTDEEKQQVGHLKARCSKILVKRGFKRGSEEFNNLIDVTSGFWDEWVK